VVNASKFLPSFLCQSGFLRVHKSHLVNLHHITKYHKGKGGEVIMSDGQHIAVSAQKKESLMSFFDLGR
jgi:two-component system, LytTR family, response regulator